MIARRHLFFLSWLLLLVLIPTAYAGPREDAASKSKEGDRLMAEGDYKGALDAYDEAKRLFDNSSIELLRAEALLKLRRYDDAKDAYQTYLNAGKANKQNQSKIKEALVSIEQISKTTLVCDSTPQGATVYLDSRVDGLLGTTPLTAHLSPGSHRLTFEKAGFISKIEPLEITEGAQLTLNSSLQPLPLTIETQSNPSGAAISLDGVPQGNTPIRLKTSPGKHTISLMLDSYEPISEAIEGEAGGQLTFSRSLTAAPGKLVITTRPAKASLQIEGRQETQTGSGTMALPAGSYTLVARADGYSELRQPVEVRAGQDTPLSLSLVANAGLLLIKAPSSAKISIDGVSQPNSPKPLALPPGSHSLQVQAEGFQPYQGSLSLSLESLTTAQVTLQKPPALPPKPLKISALALAGLGVSTSAGALLERSRLQSSPNVGPKARAIEHGLAITSDLSFVFSAGVAFAGFHATKREPSSAQITVQQESP